MTDEPERVELKCTYCGLTLSWKYPKSPEEWDKLKDSVLSLGPEYQIHYYQTGEIRMTCERHHRRKRNEKP